ncbi:MAG: hydroxyacylglutathione hydrolase [Rubrivivax sp.]|nr:hydroxyacylglutathione hydrolase [Rubrivivax sp.]
MNVVALPAFADNYIWMIHDGAQALVVDPGDAAVVEQALRSKGLKLQSILVTHHHADHTGGVDALRPLLSGQVHGPAGERMPQPCLAHREGDRFQALGVSFEVIDVPGHTAGHIAYLMSSGQGPAALFCGDTLFSAGCGRLFEGTAEQMHRSLGKLASLPGDTLVYCTHEYTLANMRFALAVEPDNTVLADAFSQGQATRDKGQPTLPSTIARERLINPFLRCSEATVVRSALQQGAANTSDVAVFAALRTWKNHFA